MKQLGGIDLVKELQEQKKNKKNISDSLIDKVMEIWMLDSARESEISNLLLSNSNIENEALDVTNLNYDNIFSISEIKEICVKYKLRFLDSKFFKNKIPFEAIQKIKHLENSGAKFTKFKIIAPEKLFRLGDCNEDPLLFAMIDNNNYYLIHKWGNDLKWYRKITSYPLRKIETLITFISMFSIFLTAIIPNGYISSNTDLNYLSGSRFLLFIWMMILFSGIASYVFFTFNKSFSNNSWNSKFFN